jgi:large subunit ribosomal protein L15
VKLHDLKPAPGSRTRKTRVGRGIAAGKGKTAGRGTKGQKARAGGTVPAWFEGGQTPLHRRIPKLRGFKNPFKIEYEVVNVGAIAGLVELGVLESGEMPGQKKSRSAAAAPITVNQEILRAAGLVRSLDKPMKILGNGEISTALFVVADRVSASARAKIEAAGGSVSLLEVPAKPTAAIGLSTESEDGDAAPVAAAPDDAAPPEVAEASAAPEEVATSAAAPEELPDAPKKASRSRARAKAAAADAAEPAPAEAAPAEAAPAEAAAAEAAAAEAAPSPDPKADAARGTAADAAGDPASDAADHDADA